jgi:leader peptidase (prepilin peptidase)/N-methyltransferase
MDHLMQFVTLAVITIPLTYNDIRFHRLPNGVTYSYIASGLLWCVLRHSWTVVVIGVGIACVFGVVSLMTRGFGMGDTKLIVGLALWLGPAGWNVFIDALTWGFALAGAWATALLVTRRLTMRGRLPMGPFLLLGAWVGLASC